MTDLALSAGTETWPLGPEQRVAAEHPEAAAILIVAISGDLDEARLRTALLRVAGRHEILRTAFVVVPGFRGLRARPLEAPAEPAWSVLDLRGRADAAEAMARDLAAEDGFDLGSGRTLRAVLYRLGDAEWQLVLLASPLVADRGALELIHRALRDEYAGAAVPANEDGVAYAQYVEWRAEMAADEDAAEGRRYWQDHLGPSVPPVLHLPYRHREADPAVPARREAAIDAAIARRLADFAAGRGIGLDAVLQAAWWALLARISGRAELVAGWQHDCRRDYDAFAETVGPFDKVLPLRMAADPAESFSAFLDRLAPVLDSHRGWQEHWAVEPPGRNDHLVAGFCIASHGAADGAWRLVSADGLQPFELALQAHLAEDGSLRAVALHWDGGRYDDAAIATLLEQVVTLLTELPDQLETPLGTLSPVGAAERARLLAFDATAQAPAPGPSLPAMIARWGRETPTAPALAGNGVNLDYAGLNARINGLASWLVAHGVGRESVVALDMARSPDMVVALLAVWRAGGAYLPLDPQWPQARRQLLLDQARPVLVLTDAVDPVVSGTIPVHPLAAAMAEPASAALPDLGEDDSAAYVLFTSGSTGTPKGVVIEHGQLRTYVEAASAALGLAGCRRFALTSTVAADLGNTALFGALRLGACLAVADEAEMADGAAFAGFLRRHEIDCAKLVPSHLAALLDAPEPALPATLILGGEATPRALVERILAAAPQCRVFNHYGPTETTVGVLVHAHDCLAPAWAGEALPLSRPLAGSEVLVLDAEGRLAPTGAVGELHIGGAQLCRGYLHGDPAGAFVDHPFREGRRLYRSGDLARHLPDGRLQVVGRADHQVKIRGFRVEPGEVEAALQALDGVQQAAVVVHRPEGGEARLVGFVTLASGDSAALRHALAVRLPGPMVPAQIVALDRMPRLANGKIDRRGLPDPAALAEAGAKVAPRDAVETLLRQVAAELLERPAEAIGVTDDFFDIGGNSLQVIKLVARIRKLFQLEVPPGIVFDHPSIAALAQALRGHAAPGRIDQIAALRLSLDGMSEAERAALLEKARQAKAL
ncbi:amino acid adenylation domain-containing protein [Mycobacterium sp. KBS0706]|uniref:non-ribosomal peptide synthetase n=1 Tax=Mycobacterium sp. KBS0706 TaxID=2578109 RepID=UPI00110FDC29|nr:non-ribosomal peptide synthetase [Mycobacterium sp. KBS0706]TSD84166.1 amino acid adenylation domain-containing protein [Mycobacterium sp. KBS0706]